MTKEIIVSGIQPTGRLHIGNYFGALKNFIELQNSGKYDCFFFIADLHSLTEPFEPKKSTIYKQSDVKEIPELMWLLTTLTPLGDLNRMTQFKEKGDLQKKNI